MITLFQALFKIHFYSNSLVVRQKTKNRLYPILLREELHAIVWQYTNKPTNVIVRTQVPSTQISFLVIKRLINLMRLSVENQDQSDFNYKLSIVNIHNDYKIFLQILGLALSSVLKMSVYAYPLLQEHKQTIHNNTYVTQSSISYQEKNCFSPNNFFPSNIDTSLHSTFLSIENRWHYCNLMLEANISSWIHPEIILRIVRRHIQDTCVLHILRQGLYSIWKNFENPIWQFYQGRNQIISLLWNLYALQFDNFLAWESSKLRSIIKTQTSFSIYDTSISKKIQTREFLSLFKSTSQSKILLYFKGQNFDLSYFYGFGACHYARYGSNWILSIQAQKSFVTLLYRRCNRFWKRRMGRWLQYSKFYNTKTLQYGFYCLGSLIQIKQRILKFEVTVVNMRFVTCLAVQRVYILPSVKLLIKVLSIYRFCTQNGYPLSKSSWTSLYDGQIVERFKRMRNSLAYYYSGSVNHVNLSRIYHILRYSCAKTLACKHKTTVKSIWTIYGDEISVNAFYKSKQVEISLCMTIQDFDQSKVWYLELLQQDFVALFF